MFFLYIIITIFAYVITSKLVPKTIKLGNKFSILDQPDSRKQHINPLVRIGGLSIFIGFFISFAVGYLLLNLTGLDNSHTSLILLVLCSISAFFIMGFADDVYQLSPLGRLFLQIIIASIAFNQGISINNINVGIINSDISTIQINSIYSYVLTVIWLVGVPNAINWMDGLDGLASGITAISSLAFFIITFNANFLILSLLCVCLLGSSLGFLKYNFFPAKIIMGDGGSNFIGSCLAFLGILLLPSSAPNIENFDSSFFDYYPLLILSIPIFDMLTVIILRFINQKSIFYPDRNHLHHRLIDLGLSHKKTVTTILLMHLLICGTCLIFMFS